MSDNKFIGKHSEITEKVLQVFYRVHKTLGYGFNEGVYQKSMAIELRKIGLLALMKQPIEVYYEGECVGNYEADAIVNDAVILELKAVEHLADEHEAQLLNYLKATRIEVGLLLNFGPKPEMKRRVFDNGRKGSMEWTGTDSASTDETIS